MARAQKRRRSHEKDPLPVCEQPGVDYQAALLALADEYITAAYCLKDLNTDAEVSEYHELVALGMGCLESALTKFRHTDARQEARIRLRLASLMIEETENSEQVYCRNSLLYL